MQHPSSRHGSGLPQAVGAYFIWGFLPLYIHLLREVPPFELVGWRVIFTLPVCIAFVIFRRQLGETLSAAGNLRTLALLTASSLLIGTNWLVYIAAVVGGHVLATSLGYYINPLVNVLAGTLLLGERLSKLQWTAVALAVFGVSLLVWDARDTLAISLALAISFSAYGLVRKLTPVGSLPGLTIESGLLLLPAAGIVAWHAASPAGSSFGGDAGLDRLIVLSGIITATPLLLFAVAARRMDYSTLGFVQFIAPTLQFLVGIFVFREALRPVQLACFLFIWAAMVLFIRDLWSRRKAQQRNLQG